MYSVGMIETQFAKNQKDLSLTNLGVHWMGTSVELYSKETGRMLTFLTVSDAPVIQKIMAWCVKNHYRCSQIVNGMLQL